MRQFYLFLACSLVVFIVLSHCTPEPSPAPVSTVTQDLAAWKDSVRLAVASRDSALRQLDSLDTVRTALSRTVTRLRHHTDSLRAQWDSVKQDREPVADTRELQYVRWIDTLLAENRALDQQRATDSLAMLVLRKQVEFDQRVTYPLLHRQEREVAHATTTITQLAKTNKRQARYLKVAGAVVTVLSVAVVFK